MEKVTSAGNEQSADENETELTVVPMKISDAWMDLSLKNSAMLAAHIAHCLDWSIIAFRHRARTAAPEMKKLMHLSVELMKLIRDEHLEEARNKFKEMDNVKRD